MPCVKGLISTIRPRAWSGESSESVELGSDSGESLLEKPRIKGRNTERSLLRELINCSRNEAADVGSDAIDELQESESNGERERWE